MKVEVFCGWGYGLDVGINVTLTPKELAVWNQGLVPVDLTAAEARVMAQTLTACAEQAEQLAKSYEEYLRNENYQEDQED